MHRFKMAHMALLESINGPADLRRLSSAEAVQLAAEIREFLITHVSRTGGHLGPNLGVVELTMAIHRVFDSPHDPVIFDTGHQSYVHKILTGRRDQFETLRQRGGLSGYPSRVESPHDWMENSHASTSLSWAEGLARGFHLRGEQRTVVAVIGDGALTGGMAWEALNNISVDAELPMVIVVNDNGRSYTPTVGGLAVQLAGMRTDRRYEQLLEVIKRNLSRAPLVGRQAYDVLHGVKTGIKDILAPQGMFSDLGLKYVGPIDGHDLNAVETALQQAKGYGAPVLVHCITRKGKGFLAAENHEEDQFHAVGQIDAHTGEPLSSVTPATWTSVFADELVAIGADHPEVVAITAAMLHPTGLNRFAAQYPQRVFDVGIAEQHAVASAAGLAAAGLHPVVAIYATFLNRAFDQLLMDVAMHGLGVTLVLDRAGVTGSDGASHNGMWDLSILQAVPGLHLAAPRDATRLREALRQAVSISDAPSVIRFSKERIPDDLPAIRHQDGFDVLRVDDQARVLVVGHGQMMGLAMEVAARLREQGIGVQVVDPLWALPVNPALVNHAAEYELVVSIEDGLVVGGLGARLGHELRQVGSAARLLTFGVWAKFLEHASRGELLTEMGLTGQDISREVVETLVGTSESLEMTIAP